MISQPNEILKLGIIQLRCAPDRAANLQQAIAGIEEAVDRQARVVCLPELFGSVYFCKREDPSLFDLAEPIPGPTTQKLGEVAQKTRSVIVASIFEKRAAGVYHNSIAVLNVDGSVLGIYRKMHVPDDPLYFEKHYFTPGDLGYQAFATEHGTIGTLICWDQWFPEAARLTAMKGADVLLYPTAIGWHPSEKSDFGEQQLQAWETIQRGHAIANGTYVAAVNRVGLEKDEAGGALEFWGGSFVCDPFGVVLARASSEQSEVLVVECPRARIEEVRRHWPFFRDRRIDTYADLTRRFGN